MKINNETKVGILAVAAIAILFIGYNYLRGKNVFDNSIVVQAKFQDLGGLMISNPVKIRGYQVGTISNVELEEVDGVMTGYILTTLSINQDMNIPKNAKAYIVQTGMMSGMEIELRFDKGCNGADCLATGDQIDGVNTGGFIGNAKNELMPVLDELQIKVNAILNGSINTVDSMFRGNLPGMTDDGLGQSMQNLKATINNLTATTNTLDRTLSAASTDLVATIANIQKITKNLADNNGQITQLLTNIEELTSKLNTETMGKINTSLDGAGATMSSIQNSLAGLDKAVAELSGVLESAKSGDGTLAMLLNDEKFAKQLQETIFDVQQLMLDLRLHPERYTTVLKKKRKPFVKNDVDPARQN